MSKFFHPLPLLKSTYYGNRLRLKRLLGIPQKPKTDVLNSGHQEAVARYTRICRTLLENLPNAHAIHDATVAEIGCGDCLAAADMMLGLGAKHIHLVESIPMEVTERHQQALAPLIADETLPNQGAVLADENTLRLNQEKVTFHKGFLENLRLPEPVDFLYSFDVLEHVEDLEGFFSYCGEIVRPGGMMMHKFDLSGHGLFEDPMPPLDFQTLPTWMFEIAFPKYHRAVGHFADEFFKMMENYEFTDLKLIPIRVAEPEYLDAIWPHLRSKARKRSKDIVKLLDLIVLATRKS